MTATDADSCRSVSCTFSILASRFRYILDPLHDDDDMVLQYTSIVGVFEQGGLCYYVDSLHSIRFKSINIPNNYNIQRCSTQVSFCWFYQVHFVQHLRRLN